MLYITNAFSLQMVPFGGYLQVEDLSADEAFALTLGAERVWAVGHTDIARIMSDQLGLDEGPNRVNITLVPGDRVLVGQYSGGRLPEGTNELPEGAEIRWVLVEFFEADE